MKIALLIFTIAIPAQAGERLHKLDCEFSGAMYYCTVTNLSDEQIICDGLIERQYFKGFTMEAKQTTKRKAFRFLPFMKCKIK